MTSPPPPGLDVDVTDAGVATVTIDRPPVNALLPETAEAITEAFDRLGQDPAVRAVVLTGAGKHFCAGVDMKHRLRQDLSGGRLAAQHRRSREMLNAVLECAVPVIAAVRGAVLGGGLSLVTCADIVVADTSAFFGLPEITTGTLGGAKHAARMFGPVRARRMLLTGERIGAPDAFRMGVLDYCLGPAELADVVDRIAARIVGLSPTAVRLAKKSLNAAEPLTLRDGYRLEQEFTSMLMQSAEGRADLERSFGRADTEGDT